MRYTKYGENGPKISRLAFGVMRLPARKKGDLGSVNFTKAIPVMRAAMNLGINFFDSHHQYHNGLSEVAIGKALKGWKGQRIYIQTKTPMYNKEPLRWHKKHLEEALEKTGINCIDYLLSHSMDMEWFKKRGKDFFKLTDWGIKKGYIRKRGFSSHDKPENIRKFIDTREFSVMVVSYNYLNPEMRSTITYAAKKGIGVSIMNPIGGGSLANNSKKLLRLVPGAKTPSEIALRYVWDTSGVTACLSGMNTLEQVEENSHLVDRKIMLTKQQHAIMNKRLKDFETKSMVICTGCGYCMPCPHGVDIPENFRWLNRAKLLGMYKGTANRMRALKKWTSPDKSAFGCKKCGKCEPKCPNNIPIIEQIQQLLDIEKKYS